MPSTPYAKLLVSVSSAAPTSGGLTVANGDTIDLSGESTVGWTQQRFEIYEYPVGYAAPAGWSTDAAGTYFYATDPYPPQITLPAVGTWGKFLLRLTVNNGLDGAGAPSSALVDETTALKILSPNFLNGMAHLEEGQFSTLKKWVGDLQADLVVIDSLLGLLGVPISRTLTAGQGLVGGGDLSADRVFNIVGNADGSIVINTNDIQLKTTFTALLNAATALATAGTLVLRDGSGGGTFALVTSTGLVFTATATPSITQTDPAAGGGALTTIRAQNAKPGAAANGGGLLLKTGAWGDSAHVAGNFTIDTGDLPASNVGAPVIFLSGSAGEYLRVTNDVAGLGPTILGTPSVRIGTAGPSLIIDGSVLLLSGGATVVDGPITFSRGGTATISEAAPVTGDPPGDILIKAADAFTGDAIDGGALTLKTGAPGDAGTNAAGALTFDTRERDGGGVGALVVFKSGTDGEYLRIFDDSGSGSIRSAGGLAFLSSPCALYVQPSGVSYTGQLSTSTHTITYAASVALNGNNGNKQKLTLTGNVTLAAPTNLQDGARYLLRVIQSSGGHTASWNAAFKFPSATAAADKTLSAGAGAVDLFEFESDGTSLFCVASPKNLA